MPESLGLRERMQRLAGPVDRQGVWDDIETRVTKEQSGGPERVPQSRPRSARLAVYASLALLLVAMVAVGTVFGVSGDDPKQSGSHWERLVVDSAGDYIYSLAIDPTDSSVVYAVGEMGAYKSVDGGSNWSLIRELLPGEYAQPSIVVDPAQGSTVYLVYQTVHQNGWSSPPAPPVTIIRSEDGGKSWTDLGGADPYAATWPVYGVDENQGGCLLYCDPSTTPSTLYLTNPYGAPNDYWRSTDKGKTWAKLGEADRERISKKYKPTPPSATIPWREIKDSTGWVTSVILCGVVDPKDTSVAYAGTDVGVCKSLDGGRTWTNSSVGMTHPVGGRLVFETSSPSTLYVVGYEGVFKSVDGGASWKMVLRAGYASDGTRMCSAVLAPSLPSTLYAWTADGLLRTDDGGQTWSANLSKSMLPSSDPGGMFQNQLLMVAPDDPNILFAQRDDGVVRSADGGKTWKVLFKHPYVPMGGASIVADPNDPSVMYTVTQRAPQTSEFNIMKSVDKGATWEAVVKRREASPLFTLAMDFKDPAGLYSINRAGVAGKPATLVERTVDGGSTWQKVDFSGLQGRTDKLVFDPRVPGTLYALTVTMKQDQGRSDDVYEVFRSTDGGATWSSLLNADLIAQRGHFGFARGIVVSPHSGALYGEGSLGIYKWVPAEEMTSTTGLPGGPGSSGPPATTGSSGGMSCSGR